MDSNDPFSAMSKLSSLSFHTVTALSVDQSLHKKERTTSCKHKKERRTNYISLPKMATHLHLCCPSNSVTLQKMCSHVIHSREPRFSANSYFDRREAPQKKVFVQQSEAYTVKGDIMGKKFNFGKLYAIGRYQIEWVPLSEACVLPLRITLTLTHNCHLEHTSNRRTFHLKPSKQRIDR